MRRSLILEKAIAFFHTKAIANIAGVLEIGDDSKSDYN
jgi:hypothetical protein